MKLREYLAQIEAWEKIYGKPPVVFNADPTTIKAGCDRCGKIRKSMNRHHIRNDFMFAMLRPDLYAKRYIQFHHDDVRRLCRRCHTAVHLAYDPILVTFHTELNDRQRKGLDITPEWCETWRERFRLRYESWRVEPRLVTKREVRRGTQTGVSKRQRRKQVHRRRPEKRNDAH